MLVNNAIAEQFKKRMDVVEAKYKDLPKQQITDEKDILTICFAAGHLRLNSIVGGKVDFRTISPVSVLWSGDQFIIAARREE
jgi:hypothetical protein